MKAIESIQFTLFSPEQVRKMSAAKVTVPDTYDEDGYPINGGLADQRLGVIDPGLKCKTCGGRMKDCSGHFGHIELVRPVVHVGFARTVHQLLRSCCRKCGRLMTPGTFKKSTRPSECPHCGEPQKQVSFVKPMSYYEEDRKLLPSEVRERLERIPDEDLREVGIAIRPEWMVLTVLAVPPVTVRPSITLETGERSEDDLTHKLVDILRINQRLEENVEAGAPQLIIEDLWELLQYHVTTFFDNEIAGVPPARHRSGRQLKTLFQRLKGKEGRFRYNLSGKRVNFSARTVVSPDPTLSISEIGVPTEIAGELSVPVSVTEWNAENVRKIIRANPEKINYVIRPDGRRKKLTAANLEEVLTEIAPSYIVERQLMDGDLVVFNRQPSLHRISMLCHRVRVLPGKTFRFNVAVCAPYNADFDGDEMNIHVPQNEEAQSEADILMSVEGQILSPRSGDPVITPDLDQITGLFLLTFSPDLVFPREDACTLLTAAGMEADVKRSGMSGRDLFSLLLPDDFDFEARNKACVKCTNCREEKCDYDAFFRIKKGKLVSGHFDSKINGALVRELFVKRGPETARDYINRASRLSVSLITRFGLSLSLDDYEVSREGRKEVSELYLKGRKELRELIRKYRGKRLERQPGKTQKETLEEHVMGVVEAIRHDSWKSVRKHIKKTPVAFNNIVYDNNNALLMAGAGVKSKPINVVQMAALVGQQAVRGKRMTSGYYQRILPHYKMGDLGGEARGFVRSNYRFGLTPTEYFFHAAGGRDSVVDKGVNPAKTGYMQRRLVNALQDFVVDKDSSVRDAGGKIIEFVFGDDGRDPSSGGGPIAYGEAVGVVAAQSLGEPSTQMTLRTFHYAGVASLAQLGFTRMVEIVDARKTPKKPVMEIYLQGDASRNYDKAKAVAASIERVSLSKVAKIEEDFQRKIVSLTLDRQILRDKDITEKFVKQKIGEVTPDYSEDGAEIKIKLKDDSLKNIRKTTNALREVILKGVQNIKRVIVVEKKSKGAKDGSVEYLLATEGTNLKDVLKVPGVDASRTTTNDIIEIGRVLGIEAARNAIIQEVKKVLDAQDLRVDLRHVSLIADAMTFTGEVRSVGRHGISGEKTSVLARAAFEETGKHLVHACVFGEEDKLTGVAENIIIGQTIPCGTGKVALVMKRD